MGTMYNILVDVIIYIAFGGWFNHKANKVKARGIRLGLRICQVVYIYGLGFWMGMSMVVLISPLVFICWILESGYPTCLNCLHLGGKG